MGQTGLSVDGSSNSGVASAFSFSFLARGLRGFFSFFSLGSSLGVSLAALDVSSIVIGINTDTLDNNEAGIKEAKEILKAQGASYKNLTFDSNSTVGKYAGNIMAFPTTVLVDKDGNIIGEPFMGGIDDQSNYDQLMKQIQSVIDQK